MLGGGFLGQMHQTSNQNRDLLRKSDGKQRHLKKYSQERLQVPHAPKPDTPKPDEASALLIKLKRQQKREQNIQLTIFIGSIALVGFLYYLFTVTIRDSIIDFLN